MENIVFVFQIGSFLILTGGIIWIVFSDKEKNKYRKINFKDKKEYLCVYYLYGNKDLKSNIGVLSKEGDSYLLETEDGKGLYTFSFQKEEITFVEVKEKNGIGTVDTIVDFNYDASKGYFAGHNATTFTTEKTVKVRKIYTIQISLANGITLTLESSKNPEIFFRDI